jgi:hypothetical protein
VLPIAEPGTTIAVARTQEEPYQMPRRTSRAQRKRANQLERDRRRLHAAQTADLEPQGEESLTSAAYRAGRAYRYTSRIQGPTFPVKTSNVNDT